MISENGFFNLNIDTTNIDTEKYEKSIIKKIYRNTAISDSYNLAVQMVEMQKISEVIDIYNSFDAVTSKIIKSELVSDSNKRTQTFIQATLSGFKVALKMGIIDSYSIHQPFYRLSMSAEKLIVTYFLTVSYADGKKELWVSEEIPCDELLGQRGVQDLNQYLNTAIFGVRDSIFFNNNIYSYSKNVLNNNEDSQCIVRNYILNNIIKFNFGVDVNKKLQRISIGSETLFIDSINSKNNKTKSIHLDFNSSLIFIGVYKEKDTYLVYREKVLSNIFYYEILYTVYKRFLKLAKKKRNQLQNAHFTIMAKFLSIGIKKDKIPLNSSVELLIKKESLYEKETLVNLIMRAIGAFWSEYNN